MTERDELQATLNGLENGLRVRQIATWDLVPCQPDDDSPSVAALMAEHGFDHMPVKVDGRVVAVFQCPTGEISGSVRDHMRLIDDSMLVSADAPVAQFIELAATNPYRLVVDGAGINGIVTRSDLHKLPVRVYAFTLITHLEAVMADLIRQHCSTDKTWLDMLSSGRQAKVRCKLSHAQEQHLDPQAIEFTDFCDKRTIVRKCCRFDQAFERDLKRIETLRNKLAHAGSYADTHASLQDFVECVAITAGWIDRLQSELRTTVQAVPEQ